LTASPLNAFSRNHKKSEEGLEQINIWHRKVLNYTSEQYSLYNTDPELEGVLTVLDEVGKASMIMDKRVKELKQAS